MINCGINFLQLTNKNYWHIIQLHTVSVELTVLCLVDQKVLLHEAVSMLAQSISLNTCNVRSPEG